MRFIHSADWQLGARFRQFGAKAETLRAARLRTLRRALEHAASVRADAFLVAGDLFEDNQVEAALVREVFELFASFTSVPIYLLPGNHDPFTGPGCVWARLPFSQPPEHLKIFTAPEAVQLGDAWLLASPLTQKRSLIDPSLRLVDLARTLPTDAVKIGLTHGSPAIGAKHQSDDFPIDLAAATRAELDYLAIGHWHSTQSFDGGRLVMPGTPEPTSFDEHGAGFLQQVEITSRGAQPVITPIAVAELSWRGIAVELSDTSWRERFTEAFASCDPARAVVRVTIRGEASPEAVAEAGAWLEEKLTTCVVQQVHDETTLAFTPEEIAEVTREHPLLAQMLGDLRAIGDGIAPAAELRTLAERAALPPEAFSPEGAALAQRLLLHEWREVLERC